MQALMKTAAGFAFSDHPDHGFQTLEPHPELRSDHPFHGYAKQYNANVPHMTRIAQTASREVTGRELNELSHGDRETVLTQVGTHFAKKLQMKHYTEKEFDNHMDELMERPPMRTSSHKLKKSFFGGESFAPEKYQSSHGRMLRG